MKQHQTLNKKPIDTTLEDNRRYETDQKIKRCKLQLMGSLA